MAGDWIKMRTDLISHPKVFRIVSELHPHSVRNLSAIFPQAVRDMSGIGPQAVRDRSGIGPQAFQDQSGSHPKAVVMPQFLTDRFRVVGGLHAVWCVFDAHSIDGVLPGYTLGDLDNVIGWHGFSAAMLSVGWLIEKDGGGLVMPEFDAHNSKSAKRRAEDSRRKQAARGASAKRPK